MNTPSVTARRDGLGLANLVVLAVLVFIAAINLTVLAANTVHDDFGGDLRRQYYPAAQDVVDGRPLYRDAAALPDSFDVLWYPYPPLVAVAFTPVTVLSEDGATVVVFLAAVAAILATLWLVGVRDVRCYLVLFAWPPLWNELDVLNLSAFLALALAVAWRTRHGLAAPAAALGCAIAAKLFLWPLLVWAAATGRMRQTALTIAVGVGVALGSWALIGFQGLTEYPALLRKLADVNADSSYSIQGMIAAAGLPSALSTVLAAGIGATLVALAWRYCRRGDEERGLLCAVVAALALSPIVWQHYLLLLLVPLGVLRPRFSLVWFVPMLAWMSPRFGNGDGFEPFVPALVVALICASLLRARPGDPAPREVSA